MKKKEVVTDLKDLNPSDFPASSDNSLELDLSEINIPEVNEKEAQKVQENADVIASWMKTHLAKLDGLNAQPKAFRARPEIEKAIKAILSRIDFYMNHDEPGYRQIAWMEFLTHQFESTEIKTWNALDQITDGLIRKQRLEGVKRGPLETPWGKCMAIPRIASFGAVQFEQIGKTWNKLLKCISRETAENRAERVSQLKKEADTSDIDLLNIEKKIDGTALVYVPAEISIRNGEMKIFNPGFLLVRREGDKFFPIEGVGSFDKRIEDMGRGKTYILSFTLAPDWTRPPSKKMLIEEKGFTEAQANNLCFAWYLLKRACQHLAKSNEERPEEFMMLGKQAGMPANEFLLGRQEGTALIELDGSVAIIGGDKNRTVIERAFFLVEREKKKFKLLAVPSNLQTMLNAESFIGEYAEGDQFEGLPQPLQALLKMAYLETMFKQMLEQ